MPPEPATEPTWLNTSGPDGSPCPVGSCRLAVGPALAVRRGGEDIWQTEHQCPDGHVFVATHFGPTLSKLTRAVELLRKVDDSATALGRLLGGMNLPPHPILAEIRAFLAQVRS